jgi:probable O-glycosylation ligase (exosortase A-associated)
VKQTLFMGIVTLIGMIGSFTVEPFVGVAVYYLYAVLRPQYLWVWALPEVSWSEWVAWTTIAGTAWWLVSADTQGATNGTTIRFSFAHKAFFAFGVWICVSYVTAQNRDVAWQWLIEYLKIFLMFGVASLVISRVQQLWTIYVLSTIALIYIAYELNFLYFTATRTDIYRNGYGGLDNNGAGLMIAMGVPLAIHAWEASQKWWRWVFVAGVPLLIHAVLMSYSRGAMLSLLVAAPFLIARSCRKKQFSCVLLFMISIVPSLAGREIRDRFFSVQDYDTDASATSRFDSWNAAIRIANEYPIFGVGIRNSVLFSYQYGADMEGRVIHSQYLQTLTDTGYPGLSLYLLALISTWIAIIRTRRALKESDDAEAPLARSMLSGIEGSLVIFWFGALFLSVEVFELPYILALMAVQLSLVMRIRKRQTSPSAELESPAVTAASVAVIGAATALAMGSNQVNR